jgi:hypothetical protein
MKRFLGLAVTSLLASSCGFDTPSEPEGARRVKRDLHELARARVEAGMLARTDGYVYAVDVALLMIFAAGEGDEAMYGTLRDFALEHLLLDSDDDPYTRGFVVWRYCEGLAPDASGTTEALRLAEGMWRGAAAFDIDTDRETALVVLDGYARHAAEEQGVWMIRNYFNLGTRSFATNSFLVDYAPDFVAEVAEATGREDLAHVAERSYELIEKARAPTSGLLYAMIQPEVATLLDDERAVIFSPNDAIQFSNTATVALCAVRGRPAIGREVVDFAHERMPQLRGTYYGRTAEVAREKRPGIEAWSALVRLAIALDDDEALHAFYPFLVSNAGRKWRIPKDAWLYVTAELLLGLQAVTDAEESS